MGLISLWFLFAKVKSLSAMLDTQVWSLGRGDPLEKGMATHSSILAWRISWTEGPGGLQPVGLQRVGHDWAANIFTLTFCFIEGTKLMGLVEDHTAGSYRAKTWTPVLLSPSFPPDPLSALLHSRGRPASVAATAPLALIRSVLAGVPNLWDLMPDDLRWRWCNKNRN